MIGVKNGQSPRGYSLRKEKHRCAESMYFNQRAPASPFTIANVLVRNRVSSATTTVIVFAKVYLGQTSATPNLPSTPGPVVLCILLPVKSHGATTCINTALIDIHCHYFTAAALL